MPPLRWSALDEVKQRPGQNSTLKGYHPQCSSAASDGKRTSDVDQQNGLRSACMLLVLTHRTTARARKGIALLPFRVQYCAPCQRKALPFSMPLKPQVSANHGMDCSAIRVGNAGLVHPTLTSLRTVLPICTCHLTCLTKRRKRDECVATYG